MAHMHYKGTGKVHSFRGLLADGGQRKIRIQGPVGAIAWRITKLEGFPNLPGTQDCESVLQIFREEQSAVSITIATVDFDNAETLAASFYVDAASGSAGPVLTTIMDNALFVRNIWITHTDTSGSQNMNYYIELEEVKVSKAGMAQLAVAAARRTID